MPVLQTLELGDPRLRQPAQPVDQIAAPEIQALLGDLWDTLDDFRQRHGWGRALAAPVVGVALRVVVLTYETQRLVLINPRFESWSRTQTVEYERCIAFGSIWGQVYRPERVVVVAEDAAGAAQRFDVDGELARLIQHEIDHLDGLVWLDREPDLATICTAGERARQRTAQPPTG
ncbi:MAG: peptide deformylase [Chloroflexota bacterium]|nr:peptide deformylase [Chloroflexota bacterium]PLS83410.1 MAG: peptide deformylase [Chloroflexota bacterium]